jgi:hypothetical protein
MFGRRRGFKRAGIRSLAMALGLTVLGVPGVAAGKPKETKAAAATRLEKSGVQEYVSGDTSAAVRSLERAVEICEPAGSCPAKTRARLHVSLGIVKGAGMGDYAAAKGQFATALVLDPEARLNPALSNAKLEATFEEARRAAAAAFEAARRAAAAAAEKKPADKPADKPATEEPVNIRELLHPEEEEVEKRKPPAEKRGASAPRAQEAGPPVRYNWFSARVMMDFAFISDANICSPGAPSSYFCTDETGARYAGRPQPNEDVTPGFALATGRIVLGYERVLVAGLSAGAFAGFAFGFAGVPEGRSSLFPIHLEARATYTFGKDPYAAEPSAGQAPSRPGGGASAQGWLGGAEATTGVTEPGILQRLHPFVYLGGGSAEVDSSVIIRLYEIPCGARPAPACKRDLTAHRRVGRVFGTLGTGVRFRVDARHALRAGGRAMVMFGDGSLILSPEVAYELGF